VQWLKATEKSGDRPLDKVDFAVFGLGNRQYEHFNKVPRRTKRQGGSDANPFLTWGQRCWEEKKRGAGGDESGFPP
jgi:sulfite reductase alpha subunit-like flavoprotein